MLNDINNIELNDGRMITLKNENKTNLEGGLGVYNVYDESGKTFGFLKYSYDDRIANLDNIFVDNEFSGRGIGGILLDTFEKDIAANTQATRIVGVFVPRGISPYALKKFYSKYGYDIEKDNNGDFLVIKNITREREKIDTPTL